jgi:hypothetical protein
MKHKYDREVVWLSKTESFLIHQEQLMRIIEEKLEYFSKFIQSSFEIQNGERYNDRAEWVEVQELSQLLEVKVDLTGLSK